MSNGSARLTTDEDVSVVGEWQPIEEMGEPSKAIWQRTAVKSKGPQKPHQQPARLSKQETPLSETSAAYLSLALAPAT